MALGKLEPLYRYLRSIDIEPISAVLRDINALAKSGYVRKTLYDPGDGRGPNVSVVTSVATDHEITSALAELVGVPSAHHFMVQAIENKMFFSISRINGAISKTILAASIDDKNRPTLDFIESDAVFNDGLLGKSMWSSVVAVVVNDAGETSSGFIRNETRFVGSAEADEFALKIDFKSSRTEPFFISVHGSLHGSLHGAASTILFGTEAKRVFMKYSGE